MLSIDQVVNDNYPALGERKVAGPFVKALLRRFLREKAFRDFAENYPHLRGNLRPHEAEGAETQALH